MPEERITDEEAIARIAAAWREDTDWRTFGVAAMTALKEAGALDRHPRPDHMNGDH